MAERTLKDKIKERILEVNREMHICLMGFEKASGTIDWNSLLKILKDIG